MGFFLIRVKKAIIWCTNLYVGLGDVKRLVKTRLFPIIVFSLVGLAVMRAVGQTQVDFFTFEGWVGSNPIRHNDYCSDLIAFATHCHSTVYELSHLKRG